MNSCPICTFSAPLISLLINTVMSPFETIAPPRAAGGSAPGFFLEDLHRHRDEAIQLVVGGLREHGLRPDVVLGPAVALQQAPDEGEERDTFELAAPFLVTPVLRCAHRGLEALRVSQGLRRERRDDL